MSLIPFARMCSWDPWSIAPQMLYNQGIGMDLMEMEREMKGLTNAKFGFSELNVDNNHFEVKLDCHHFKPEEMNVKVNDNTLTIHAKHEEKQDDHGYISREFTRKYTLPPGCDLTKLKSQLTQDGMLSIDCPRQVVEEKGVRNIPIERSSSSRQAIKHN
ncbi:unnamed protein product [Gordionus sp. m RMFG-2023]|uniref:alpha-crystallin A chain-like n=1 Tax=Gordionus sp. m RMFG-2023 TaxID=3053472 RepID=UPI0030E05BF6